MVYDRNDENYLSRIDSHLKIVLDKELPVDLTPLLHRMRGAPPDVVLNLLRRQGQLAIRGTSSVPLPNSPGSYEPHPLDYDWRFTPECATELGKVASEAGSAIALFGMPTVHKRLIASGFRATLVDRNPLAAAHAPELVCLHDLCQPGQTPLVSTFDAVFLDPPWYPEILLAWLEHALLTTREKATIWFSLWGEFTRPSAAYERKQVFELLSSRGQLDVYPDVLRYDMPLFERLSFKAGKVPVDHSWRTGDLVRFQKAAKCTPPPRRTLQKLSEWWRFNIGGRQIAVRVDAQGGPARLQPIGEPPSWHLKSVSRRDPLRYLVDLWASNNWVAKLSGSQHFADALCSLVPSEDSADLSSEGRRALDLVKTAGLVSSVDVLSGSWRHNEWTIRD